VRCYPAGYETVALTRSLESRPLPRLLLHSWEASHYIATFSPSTLHICFLIDPPLQRFSQQSYTAMFPFMQPVSILLALLSASTTLAVPMDHRLEDIQCRCVSFSTDAKPTLCTYMESYRLDWHTASSFAKDHDLKIQFASESTITKILSIHRPLPSNVLQTLKEGEVMTTVDETDLMQRENRIVCGFGDEVKQYGSDDRSMEPECHYVGYFVTTFMLLIALYLVAEYMWSRYAYHEPQRPHEL
jgi:hypothetical protein